MAARHYSKKPRRIDITDSGMSTPLLRRFAALAFQLIVALSGIVIVPDAQAAGTHYRMAPPAQWITLAQPETELADAPGKPAGGSWILLFDRQVNVTADGDDFYQHVAAKVLDDAGVEERSQVDLRLDPAFQSVDLHFIRVIRGGKVTDAMPRARVTELPEETRLRERIYNGRYHVNILLSDVRAGDVVEYAYTLHSREILFPGRFAAAFTIGWADPIRRERVRVRWPKQRDLHLRFSDGSKPAAPRTVGDSQEWVLQRQDLAAISLDDDTPGWYSQLPRLEVTEYQDWSAVARVVDPMFAQPAAAGARVTAVAREIRTAGGSPEQLALRALQYVQEQITYVSIAIGRGGYEPASPETVLERRYGDCKDKSVLLVALLRQLGIESRAALVNSYRGRALSQSLPSPFEFDHAIVRAQIGAQTYWLDGTASKQYAELSSAAPADFERALVLNADSRELDAIPRPSADSRQKSVFMTFDLREGLQKPASLRVVTQYADGQADGARSYLKRVNPQQREKDYLNYVVRYYPTAKPAAPIEIRDDKERDILEIEEHYHLETGFTETKEQLKLMLHADELYRYFDTPDSSVRQSPLALSYPVDIRQTLSVYLPEEWPVTPEKTRIDNPAFLYESDISYAGRTLEVTYHYRALRSEVEPAALQRYFADRKRVYDDLGYSLTRRLHPEPVERPGVAPVPLFALLLSTGLSIWGALRLARRWDPEPAQVSDRAPRGIGGWLILPAFGALIGPVFAVWMVITWLPFINAGVWEDLPDRLADGYRGSAHAILMTTVLLTGPLLVAYFLQAYLFFTKRTAAPRAFIITSWFAMVYGTGVGAWAIFAGLDQETKPAFVVGELTWDFIVTAIWTVYMLRSERVKATFQTRAKPLIVQPNLAASITS
jgi:transglutaminase-like putative cysteine protease